MSGVTQLRCRVQHYDWGCVGNENRMVARMAFAAQESHIHSRNKDDRFAEIWFGVHPNGCSLVNEEKLNIFLDHHPEYLGRCHELPFLLKILSVSQALSIQAHPDKSLATFLHENDPEHYKDPNHKPELAYALTDFEAFVGFRDVESIRTCLSNLPEISAFVSHATDCRDIFHIVMTCQEIRASIPSLVERLRSKEHPSPQEELCLRLSRQYPGDIGLLAPFLFNFVTLVPGDAVFISAGEPHAYISGDCVEIMACSDNVVRAGLTNKHMDVKTLCNMLTYNDKTIPIMKGTAVPFCKHVFEFIPPVSEFRLQKLSLPQHVQDHFPAVEGPSILIILEGQGKLSFSGGSSLDLRVGSAWLIGAGTEVHIQATETLLAFRGCVNS